MEETISEFKQNEIEGIKYTPDEMIATLDEEINDISMMRDNLNRHLDNYLDVMRNTQVNAQVKSLSMMRDEMYEELQQQPEIIEEEMFTREEAQEEVIKRIKQETCCPLMEKALNGSIRMFELESRFFLEYYESSTLEKESAIDRLKTMSNRCFEIDTMLKYLIRKYENG